MLDVEAAAEGEIESGQGVALPDGRRVGIGIRSLMACRRDDLAARLDYLERAALPRLATA